MNRRTFSTIAIALLTSAAFLKIFGSHARALDFPKGSPEFFTDYHTALKVAKDKGKPIVVIFSAVWCAPCQANKHQVYPSDAVKPYHDKFVWAYLDADAKVNVPAMLEYGVSGIPHIQFLNKYGKPIGSSVGATTPVEFAELLKATLRKAGS
jgi:thiol:disulfide interchange protein